MMLGLILITKLILSSIRQKNRARRGFNIKTVSDEDVRFKIRQLDTNTRPMVAQLMDQFFTALTNSKPPFRKCCKIIPFMRTSTKKLLQEDDFMIIPFD